MVEEQSRGQSAVPRQPPPLEWIWDERFRRWMRVPSLLVRPSVPVKCKYKDFETLFFFFSRSNRLTKIASSDDGSSTCARSSRVSAQLVFLSKT